MKTTSTRLTMGLAALLALASPASAQDATCPRVPSETEMDAEGVALDALVRAARERAPSLDAADAAIDAAEARERAALVGFFPTLSARASYTRIPEIDNDPIVPIDTSQIGSAQAAARLVEDRVASSLFTGLFDQLGGLGESSIRVPTDLYGLRVQASYPLSDVLLAILPRQESREAETESRRFQREAAERELELRVRELYWAHTRARWLAAVAERAVETLEAHRCDAVAAMDAGAASPVDLAEVDAALLRARIAQRRAEAGARATAHALATLSGLRGAPALGGTRYGFPELVCEDAASDARTRRPEVLALLAAERASARGATATRAAAYPHLAIAAGFDLANPNRLYTPLRDRFDLTWDVSVQLSFDLDAALVGTFEADALDASARQRAAEREAFLERAETEAAQACEELSASARSLDDAREATRRAEVVATGRREALRLGRGNEAELLDAELALAQSEAEEVALRGDAEIAHARWAFATCAPFERERP